MSTDDDYQYSPSDTEWARRVEQLMEQLGLNKSESETTIMLRDGLSTDRIAELRQVSVDTIRSQIKSTLKKRNRRNM